MPDFLYFVPSDKSQITAAELRGVGLGYLGLKGNPMARRCRGPAGDGLVFSVSGGGAAYKPKEQEWQAGPDARYHVGRDLAAPPGPADLQKKRFVAGIDIELADAFWTIPICLSLVQGSTLPKSLAIGADGKTWEMRRLPEFVSLCNAAERVWSEFRRAVGQQAAGQPTADPAANAGPAFTMLDAADYAVQALGVNYRIGPIEASLLGLLTTESCRDILEIMIDWKAVVEVARSAGADEPEKKSNTPGTSDTAAGVTA